MSRPRLLPILVILTICALIRLPAYVASLVQGPEWLAYPANFSPLYGLCLFSAATYRNRIWAYLAPLLAYVVGTLLIAVITNKLSDALSPMALFPLVGFAMFLLVGKSLRGRSVGFGTALGAGTLGAVLFFLVTNFSSWWLDPMMTPPTGYTRDLSGLVASYVAGIPFSWMQFASTIFFSVLFFSPAMAPVMTTDAPREPQLVPTPVAQ
ncbi:MAG: DUF6580 family putative transport protein [Planctomycetaceae bacterium]